MKITQRTCFTTIAILLITIAFMQATLSADGDYVDYKVLATSRARTLERELNEYARDGFFLSNVMGGETSFGGEELVAIMERRSAEELGHPYEYLVLATSRTGTMEREIREAARRGYVFFAQTSYSGGFAGREVVVVMERHPDFNKAFCEYSLVATQRVSTLEDELFDYSSKGFSVRDLTVTETAFGGQELLVTMERCPLSPDTEDSSIRR